MMETISEMPRPPSSSLSDAAFAEQLTRDVKSSECQTCEGCRELILDRYFLLVNDACWHTDCLRCCVCCVPLDQKETCFVKDDNIYCRQDYISEFGTKCSKCNLKIQASDWVRKARDKVFHLACFACHVCQRQFSTGEEFALTGDQVLCVRHYRSRLVDNAGGDSEVSCKQKTKRVRSSFTEEQLQILQVNFSIDNNPDSQALNRIAVKAGISRRVAQVWFQNARARQKKQQLYSNQTSQLSSSFPRVQWSSGSDGQFSDSTSE